MASYKVSLPQLFPTLLAAVFFTIQSLLAQTIIPISIVSPLNDSITPDTRPASDPLITHILDSSIPAPTRFCWNSVDSSKLLFDFVLSEDTVFTTNEVLFSGISDTQCAVWNLKINTKYFWAVFGKDSSNIFAASAVHTFKTPDLWPRMLYIDGTKNVRDIGGMTTPEGNLIRQGLFFRGAELNQTYNVTQKGLEQLYRLGIVSEIDLRDSLQNPRIVMSWLLRYIRPVNEDGSGMEPYASGLKNTTVSIRAVFKEMAVAKNYPMFLHCRIGADRTGTIAAILEAILGCSEQQMGLDYIWTSLSLSPTSIRDTTYSQWTDMIAYLKSFDKETNTIQRGCWNYLQSIGVSVKELIAIRKIFLNDDRQPYPPLSTLNKLIDSKSAFLVSIQPHINLAGSSGPGTYYHLAMATPIVFDLSGKRVYYTTPYCGNSRGVHSVKLPCAAGLYFAKIRSTK
jgi:protein-tyrosine phosphatase